MYGPQGVKVLDQIRKDPRYNHVRAVLREIPLKSIKALLTLATTQDKSYLERDFDLWPEKRASWPDMTEGGRRVTPGEVDAFASAWRTLCSIVADVVNSNNIELHTYVPPQQTAVWGISDTDRDRILSLTKDKAVVSSPVRSRGGIDLNFQPQFIQRSSQANSAGIQEAKCPSHA